MMQRVAVVIVNYRTPELTLHCVSALAKERAQLPSLRAIVVDGGSADGSSEKLQEGLRHDNFTGWIELLPLETNGGFGWANNQAILRLLQGSQPPEYIHLLNPDASIQPGAVLELLQELESHPEAAACGSLLLGEDGARLGCAFRFPTPTREFARGLRTAKLTRLLGIQELLLDPGESAEADWVTGASVMMRSAALQNTGLFDDGFFLYFEEVELMWRLRRAGWTIRHCARSRVQHVGGAATGVGRSDARGSRRLPDYWHQSRYRFFTLAYGPVKTALANIFWLLGHCLWLLRALLQHRLDVVPHEAKDHLRLAWLHPPRCLQRSDTHWTQPPGREAAWSRAAK
jgi:N-acetylglucosaminyl-diphospho-decaprenol L-rhamnosyltransferase